MMNEEFKSCFYCKYYKDGKCLRLTEDIDFDYGFDVLLDKYLSESDMNISAEAHLVDVLSIKEMIKGIMNVFDLNSVRVGIKKRVQIKKDLSELLNGYYEKYIQGSAEFASDTVLNLKYERGLINEVMQLEVEPTFCCRYWR